MDRLEKFYAQTFWYNVDVFRCCQAAIAIAKRGFNVDRFFIGISPGGVGQSLYSLHLSEMYKHNDVYFDPNIWYLDEELRQQVETFARLHHNRTRGAGEQQEASYRLLQKGYFYGRNHGAQALWIQHEDVPLNYSDGLGWSSTGS